MPRTLRTPALAIMVILLGLALSLGFAPEASWAAGGLPDAQVLTLGPDEGLAEGAAEPLAADASQANTSLPSAGTWTRLAGATALDTMGAVVRAGFSKSDYVIVATNAGYWDALSASGLAGLYECPIVLTDPKTLSSQASEQIKRLGAKNVIIVGGKAAVSQAVANAIARLGCKVTRIGGSNACETSYKIWQFGKGRWGGDVICATVNGFWDALSISPYAYAKKAPIILFRFYDGTHWAASGNHHYFIDACAGGKRLVIVGGNAAVSSEVDRAFPGCIRLKGPNAYETSLAIAVWCVGQGMKAEGCGVATGTGYWDALVAGPFCGKKNTVLVLASEDSTTTISGFIKARSIKRGYIFGGTAAISKKLESKINGTYQNPNPTYLDATNGKVTLTGTLVREEWPTSKTQDTHSTVAYLLVLDEPTNIRYWTADNKKVIASNVERVKVGAEYQWQWAGDADKNLSSITMPKYQPYIGKKVSIRGYIQREFMDPNIVELTCSGDLF